MLEERSGQTASAGARANNRSCTLFFAFLQVALLTLAVIVAGTTSAKEPFSPRAGAAQESALGLGEPTSSDPCIHSAETARVAQFKAIGTDFDEDFGQDGAQDACEPALGSPIPSVPSTRSKPAAPRADAQRRPSKFWLAMGRPRGPPTAG